MEGDCHHPVSEVEGFLNSITMVDVDINVEHPRVVPGMRPKPEFEVEGNPSPHLPKQGLELGSPSHLKPNTTSSLWSTLDSSLEAGTGEGCVEKTEM